MGVRKETEKRESHQLVKYSPYCSISANITTESFDLIEKFQMENGLNSLAEALRKLLDIALKKSQVNN